MMQRVKAWIEVEKLRDGAVIVSLLHPKHHGQWAKIRVERGGSLFFRAIKAVYGKGQAGDADCYMTAYGMSDEEAFRKGTWTGK